MMFLHFLFNIICLKMCGNKALHIEMYVCTASKEVNTSCETENVAESKYKVLS